MPTLAEPLDSDPGNPLQYHSFVASVAPWAVLPDASLPRYEAANPKADARASAPASRISYRVR